MKKLILALLVYVILLGLGFVIDVSMNSAEHKFMLVLTVLAIFFVPMIRFIRRLSRLENAIFVTILIATLTILQTLRDIERGYITPFTLFAFFILAGSFAETIYLMRKNRYKTRGDKPCLED